AGERTDDKSPARSLHGSGLRNHGAGRGAKRGIDDERGEDGQAAEEKPAEHEARSTGKTYSSQFRSAMRNSSRGRHANSSANFGKFLESPDFLVKFWKVHLVEKNQTPGRPEARVRILQEKILTEARFHHLVLLDLNYLCQPGEGAVVLVARKRCRPLGAEV